MIFDTHMHCQYSIDSKMSAEEAKAAALQQNLGIIITEHWDEDYPTNPEAFVFDIEDYFKQLWPIPQQKKCCLELRWACRKKLPLTIIFLAENILSILFWGLCTV